MIRVPVSARTEYDVVIGTGLLCQSGKFLASLYPHCRIAIVTDSQVAALYLSTVTSSLNESGYEVCSYQFPNGESSKNLSTFGEILEFLAASSLSGSDLVVALGGGVVGDMAGFAASVYRRGISFIQVPTTLLAAVDSSVGGKTAVNLSAGKNLAGTITQPKFVLCDMDTFRSLSPEHYSEGIAEIIKYAFLSGGELYTLVSDSVSAHEETIIAECVRQKAALVHQDEFDAGSRQLLNFGHTIGHAIEQCSNYCISHGNAVAVGMLMMTRACVKRNLCSFNVYQALEALLNKYRLPTRTDYSPEQLYTAALQDKKHRNGMLNIVIPEEIGRCRLSRITDHDLFSFLQDSQG